MVQVAAVVVAAAVTARATCLSFSILQSGMPYSMRPHTSSLRAAASTLPISRCLPAYVSALGTQIQHSQKSFVVFALMLSDFSTAIMWNAVCTRLTCITLHALLQAIQAASAR